MNRASLSVAYLLLNLSATVNPTFTLLQRGLCLEPKSGTSKADQLLRWWGCNKWNVPAAAVYYQSKEVPSYGELVAATCILNRHNFLVSLSSPAHTASDIQIYRHSIKPQPCRHLAQCEPKLWKYITTDNQAHFSDL